VNVNHAINIDDLRKMAKRRLPRIIYDFIEGGVEDELGIARNEAAYDRERLVPHYLVDVSKRDQTVDLFDRRYASPFGISATGLAALFRPGADLMLAESAAQANIPFMMSGLSTASIEAAAKVAPSHSWYQLYVARDREITLDLIRRVREAGFSTLVLTVDVPASTKRERNLRNGFALPPRISAATILDALRHRPHPMHSTVEQSLALVQELRPKRAWFTHICHDLAHEKTNASLPENVRLAYDGMRIEVKL